MRGDAGETEPLPAGLGVTVAVPVKGKAILRRFFLWPEVWVAAAIQPDSWGSKKLI